MKPALMILAAGMASRYGSMKQTEGFGPNGETIMDYSIYDAIKAGFGKIVFIIREDFAENFKANFEPKLRGKVNIEYVYQSLDKLVDANDIPEGRVKPWGTGHAVLCAKDVVHEPFAVINADDFYGADAFVKAYKFLTTQCDEKTWSIIGYRLNKTLSDHGTVSRGVCEVDVNNNLTAISERTKIHREGDEIIFEDESGNKISLGEDAPVSMNFWCMHQSAFPYAMELFTPFVKNNQANLKAEFFIPVIADEFIKQEGHSIKVITTDADWFGVTYKEDAPSVKASLDKLINAKVYPENLWG